MKKFLPLIALILAVVVSGCTQQQELSREEFRAQTACTLLCKAELNKGPLDAGPCLSNDLLADKNWVCDVVHSPRNPVDNDPANQCPAYGQQASRFVEVNPSCEFIRAV